jgi:diadenosine tetraphosphatase ApaH/serine/threonine PP2A family protein phosphatase
VSERAPFDRRALRGPFDVIGDVHGCLDELLALLGALGYAERDGVFSHPARTAVFLGDLVDRGPRSLDCLALAMRMCEAGAALAVLGNHDDKLARYLRGRNVTIGHGMQRTVAELEALDTAVAPARREAFARFIGGLPVHLVLDEGRLVVAHAGLREALQGREGPKVRAFALYGDTTGALDGYGLPVRADWAERYRGAATVVYGHTPVHAPEWRNETICVDTGCVFGGALTALRYPERELVSVPAKATYFEHARPLGGPGSGGAC